MLLTRSIRRKLTLGLGLITLMMLALTGSSISGLTSYNQVVKQLKFSIQEAPRQSDLFAAIGLLNTPLAIDFPPGDAPDWQRQVTAEKQQEAFERTVAEVRSRLESYTRQLGQLPPSVTHSPSDLTTHHLLIDRLQADLDAIADTAPLLARLDRRDEALAYIIRQIADLNDSVEKVPDPKDQMLYTLDRARKAYQWHFSLVTGAAIAAMVMFIALAVAGYRWVLVPIRKLSRGAEFVAKGNFDYRINLRTGDEISDLADAFNEMTARFQAVKNDLDRQVNERSKQLVKSAQLAGVGFLSAGVAHEINNPLNAIALAAESIEGQLPTLIADASEADQKYIKGYLAMMQSEAFRCREITEKMLNFARGQNAERNLYDVTAIVEEVVEMMRVMGNFKDRTITINRELPCYAWINAAEIKQVVLNLVANSLDALQSGGLLEVEINELPEQVEIIVRDDGAGMSIETLDHLFEPFFTTKDTGKGTGLGLSISHRIVEDHFGTLEAESAGSGQGSTFRLRVPKQAQQVQTPAA